MNGHLWFFYAVAASVVWGLRYAASGKLMEYQLTPAFLLLMQCFLSLPVYFWFAARGGRLRENWEKAVYDPSIVWIFALYIAAGVLANYMILASISMKNATIASLIEISYPLFITLFAFILFREVHLNWNSAAGAALIFAGIGLIYLKS